MFLLLSAILLGIGWTVDRRAKRRRVRSVRHGMESRPTLPKKPLPIGCSR
jgi:hypothetical protein